MKNHSKKCSTGHGTGVMHRNDLKTSLWLGSSKRIQAIRKMKKEERRKSHEEKASEDSNGNPLGGVPHEAHEEGRSEDGGSPEEPRGEGEAAA